MRKKKTKKQPKKDLNITINLTKRSASLTVNFLSITLSVPLFRLVLLDFDLGGIKISKNGIIMSTSEIARQKTQPKKI
jgi:hypothetical protein